MTLLFVEGFEGYDQNDTLPFLRVGSSLGGGAASFPAGRDGRGKCMNRPSDTSPLDWRYTVPGILGTDTIVWGFAFKITGSNQNNTNFYWYADNGSQPFRMLRDYNTLTFYINSVQQGQYVGVYDNWYYIEIKLYLHDTAGVAHLKIDGNDIFNLTSHDTKPAGATNLEWIRLDSDAYNGYQIDDMYILNTLGSKANDFLGDCRVDQLLINGDGNYSQMTPSAGSNYQCVDEDLHDDTDYVEADTTGEKDSFTYADVPTEIEDTDIQGIMIRTVNKRTEAVNNIKARTLLRTGAADYYDQAGVDQLDYFHVLDWALDEDPSDSGAWTKAKINACEFGAEVVKT